MNKDEKIMAFKELVESAKENAKYFSKDFDPYTELENGRKEKYPKIDFETDKK